MATAMSATAMTTPTPITAYFQTPELVVLVGCRPPLSDEALVSTGKPGEPPCDLTDGGTEDLRADDSFAVAGESTVWIAASPVEATRTVTSPETVPHR